MLILFPDTVYDVDVEYSTCRIISTTSVLVVVSAVTVPLVKLGTTDAAFTGAAKSIPRMGKYFI